MASLRVLEFDHEGRPIQFDTWLDDLQLYLLSDSMDNVSLFDLVSGASTAPPATADSSIRSKTAQALYDAVLARYSSPATAALGHLLLPYLFPELSAFSTVAELVSHLRASDARYRAAAPAEFLDRNLLCKSTTVARSSHSHSTYKPAQLLEFCGVVLEHVGVPLPLAPSYASAAAADVSIPEDVEAASPSTKRRSSKGKGGWGGGSGSGGGGGGSGKGGGGSSGGGGAGGTIGGSGGSGGGGGGSGGSGGSGGGGTGGSGISARRVGSGGGQRQQQQRRSETLSPQQLREWFLRGASGGSCPVEGDYYQCVPPDPGIAAAALGASESGTLPGTVPAEALHTFTLDSGASRCFFRDSTTLTPLPAPVSVRLADPSGGPVIDRSSTVLPCPAVPSGSLSGLHLPSFSTNLVSTAALQDAMVTTTTPGGQRVSICTCTRTGRHLATFTRRPGSSLIFCGTTSWVTPLCLAFVACTLVFLSLASPGLCLPCRPRLPSPYLPCVEGRQRAAPHSSSFPPMSAPLQTLHVDV
ncbi:unnamed protein product [Closterium sp. NIES-53]